MTSVKEQLEARAAAWIEQERDRIALLHEWETLHAMYWLWSEGAKREGYSKNLKEFVKACKLAVEPDEDQPPDLSTRLLHQVRRYV